MTPSPSVSDQHLNLTDHLATTLWDLSFTFTGQVQLDSHNHHRHGLQVFRMQNADKKNRLETQNTLKTEGNTDFQLCHV